MNKLIKLQAGDQVELIAPASRCSDQLVVDIKNLLTSWGLKCLVTDKLFGDDLLCANTDKMRFDLLKNALFNPENKGVICVRGGYGSMRLIPELKKLTPPSCSKLFMGMSDITALNIFLEQDWHWPVIHGALALDKFTSNAINAMKSILFGVEEKIKYLVKPLNSAAKKNHAIKSSVTGGNLCLVQSSISTCWQLEAKDKIIFLEEIGERGYRVDRMLEHLRQVGIFSQAAAILFGDFIEGKEPDGSSLIQSVLERFADACPIPVVQVKGVGHASENIPMPLGTPASLQLGENAYLLCER